MANQFGTAGVYQCLAFALPPVVWPMSCFPSTAVTRSLSWCGPCRLPSPHAIRQPGQTKETGELTALQCPLLSRIM